MDLDEIDAAAKKSPMVACSLAVCRLELACIFGDYHLGGTILEASPNLLKVRPGHFSGVRFTWYEFITSAQLGRLQTPNQAKWVKRATVASKQIKEWINDGNVNCNHMLPLVNALLAWMKGKLSARKHFMVVVKSAESGTFLQDRAITLEQAALFFSKDGADIQSALSCYKKSRDLFRYWGAVAKYKSLSQKIHEINRLIRMGDLTMSHLPTTVVTVSRSSWFNPFSLDRRITD